MRWWESRHAAQLTLTYYVQVGGIGRSRVAFHPGWGACLHVDERGSKAVDVCFCGMASTQNHFGAHVYLKKTRKTSFICPSSPCPVLEAASLSLWSCCMPWLSEGMLLQYVSLKPRKMPTRSLESERFGWSHHCSMTKSSPFPGLNTQQT